MSIEYPQDATPVKSRRALKVTIASVGSAVVIAASSFVGIPVIASAQQAAANTAAVQAQAAVPTAPEGQATTADEQATLAQSDAAGAKAVTDEQAAEALAAQQAAAAAALAAQAKTVHHSTTVDTSKPYWVADPNDANGGEWNITMCMNGASIVNGVAVCD